MRDFSYKMQQMRALSCKNQGREPGRPKKNMPNKKCQLNFAPENMSLFPHPKTPHGNHRGTQRIFQSLIGTYRNFIFQNLGVGFSFCFCDKLGGDLHQDVVASALPMSPIHLQKTGADSARKSENKSELHQLKTLCL